MLSRFRHHTGLFLRDEELCSLRFVADDILKRPQFSLDGAFPSSWEGHASWDRRSAIIFDVWGFSEADDGSLDCGNTYMGVPLEFKRTLIENRIFSSASSASVERRACADLYLNHLDQSKRLTLIDDIEHPVVRGVLGSFEPEDRAAVHAIFTRLGFVARKRVRVIRAPGTTAVRRASSW